MNENFSAFKLIILLMRRFALFVCTMMCVVLMGSLTLNVAQAQGTTTEKWDAAGLKSALAGLGAEVKELSSKIGSEKYEIPAKSETLNVPIAAELSPSKRYIWLTVNLGSYKDSVNGKDLLMKNADIQPTFFYVTASGRLMVGIAIENRYVTPVILKFNIDKILADTEKTKSVWTGPQSQ